jgi:Holliday junction resolvase RusA-like endonuclease
MAQVQKKKRHYATMVSDAMVDYGINQHYFAVDEPIALEVLFVLSRCRQDLVRQGGKTLHAPTAQTFPRAKDLDNMSKFLMDALQEGLFNNDVTIYYKVNHHKDVCSKHQSRGVD